MAKNDFVIENGVLKEYKGKGGDVVIPEGVTAIGNSAFDGCKSLTSITIPESVTAIGNSAFDGCKNLTSITIPNSVTEIDKYDFSDTKFIKEIAKANNGFAIVNNILLEYTGRKKNVVIPEGVTKIGDSAFWLCKSLTSITIPEGVTKIGDSAFWLCKSLTSITIPESVTEIGESAFDGCESLTSITIPRGVTKIGESAFDGCKSLTSITIPEGVTEIGSGAFKGCSRLRTLELPAGASVDCGFTDNQNVDMYFIPNADITDFMPEDKLRFTIYFLTSADRHSDKDKEMYISYLKKQKKRITETVIENNCIAALSEILSLNLITVKDIDTYIEMANKTKKTELLTMLMDYKNKSFTSEEVEKEETRKINKELNYNPLSVTEIKKNWNFEELNAITLVITAYKGSDTEVTIPEIIEKKKVTALGECVFSTQQKRTLSKQKDVRKKITRITIPEGITKIGEWAFNGCESLTSITIPQSVTEIGSRAFEGCKSLTTVIIKGRFTKIKDNVFDTENQITLSAPAGSDAEKFANKKKNIQFKALSGTSE